MADQTFDYDLFVIGAGSGGVRASRIAAGYGARVAVAEEHRVGGTCVIRGCVPKKMLVYGAHFAEDLEDAKNFGWTIDNPKFDWSVLRDNVLKDVDRLNGAYTETLKNNEVEIILAKAKHYRNEQGRDIVNKMVRVADLTRNAFINGDISTVMSPRTVITWAENADIFQDVGFAFRLTFLNKCDELERPIVAEFYQRCFGVELPESSVNVALS